MPKSIDVDRIDRRILSALQGDPRLSNTALAEKVGLSPSPCLRRVKKLQDTGVIQNVLTVVEASLVGLEIEALVQVRLQNHSEEGSQDFEDSVREIPQVLSCFLVAGSMDYVVHLASPNVRAHTRLVKRIGGLTGVVDVRSNMVLEKIKPWSSLPLEDIET